MPIIPRGIENVRMNVSSPVPVGEIQSAGITGRNIANLGVEIQQFASQQLSVDRALKYKEGTSELENVAKQAQDFADRNSNADGSNYAQKMQEYAQPLTDEIQNKYSSDPFVKNQLASFQNTVQNHMQTTAAIRSAGMLEGYNYTRLESQIDQSADRVRENSAMLPAETKSFNALLTQLEPTIGSDKVSKIKNVYFEKVSNQLIDGLGNKQQYGKALSYLQANQENPDLNTSMDPEQAAKLGFIDKKEADSLAAQGRTYDIPVLTKGDKVQLTPEISQIMNGMDPNKKSHWIDFMRSKIKENTELRLSDLNAQIHGFERLAVSGTPLDDKQVKELKTNINANPNLTPFARVRLMDTVIAGQVANQQMQLVSSTPRDKWDTILSGFDSKVQIASAEAAKLDPKMASASQDLAAQANRLQYKNTISQVLESVKKDQEKDAANFVLQNDQRINTLFKGTLDSDPQGTYKYVSASLAKQEYLGIPSDKQKVLTRAEASTLAANLKALPDSTNTEEYVGKLQAKYGPYFTRVMSEVSAVDKSLKDYQIVGYSSPEVRTGVVDAIKNEKEIQKSIDSSEQLKLKVKTSSILVDNTMAPFKDVVMGSGNDASRVETVNSMKRLVALQVKRDLVKNPDANIQETVNKAYADIIGSTYTIADGGKSSAIVPRVLNGRNMDSSIISSYMNVYSKPENLAELNVFVPSGVTNKEEYLNSLSPSLRWVTNESQTGIKLMFTKKDGGLIPVTNSLNKPIEKSFEEINFNPPQKVKDANKGFLGRLFGG